MLFVFVLYGALAVVPISVLSAVADITDEHELTTGRRQEGSSTLPACAKARREALRRA